MKSKIAQFGLGPIGIESLKLVTTKPWADVVGAVDIDPAKAGRDLAELTGIRTLRGRKVFRSITELLGEDSPDLVLHTTVSSFQKAYDQIEPLARKGVSVVSSCEELLFPQLREPALSKKLHAICAKSGARVVGTGVNPGFVMDVLPLCLTGVSREVRGLHVQRIVNASTRREPLQRKIGSGLPPEEFRRRYRAGTAGHKGLQESLALLAHCLAWKVPKIIETGEPIVARRDIRTQFLSVRRGQTCGLHQRAEATSPGKFRLSLDLRMYLDAENPHDAIQIEGDPPLTLLLEGGVAGDEATVAALVNTAERLFQVPAGLLLMSDLTLPRWSPGG